MARRGNIGAPVDVAETTRVVEFNDVEGLGRALSEGDVAAVLCEPALTNVGIVLPEPGYHEALRELTRRHGALLIIDETYTLSAGPGGLTGEMGLQPDLLTVGKPIGAGIPAGAFGHDRGRHRPAHRGPGCRGWLNGRMIATFGYRMGLSRTTFEPHRSGPPVSCGQTGQYLGSQCGLRRVHEEVASRMRETDSRVQDPLVLDEIELYGELVIAASASEGRLSHDQIDDALGLGKDVRRDG